MIQSILPLAEELAENSFLNKTVYGVPMVLLLAIWWMTTQLKGNNSKTQNQPTVVERIRCKNCETPIPSKAQKCIHCGADQF